MNFSPTLVPIPSTPMFVVEFQIIVNAIIMQTIIVLSMFGFENIATTTTKDQMVAKIIVGFANIATGLSFIWFCNYCTVNVWF